MATIVAATAVVVVGLLGWTHLTLADGIIVSLLGLLAIDALTERIAILERIEQSIGVRSTKAVLRSRSDFAAPPVFAQNASEILVVGIHGTSVIVPHQGFLQSRLKAGCKLRVVLMNPDPKAIGVQALAAWRPEQATTTHIIASLASLDALRKAWPALVEVHLAKVCPPYSAFIVDPGSAHGKAIVEFMDWQMSVDGRPHVQLDGTADRLWFEFYCQQFEALWAESEPHGPTSP